MKYILPRLYADYGRYIDTNRAIPFYIDALKPVQRRLLISLYQIARNKFVKSAKVVGHCVGNYHPHGDASTYDALVNLVHRGFVDPQGNFGNDIGKTKKPPAAMRYTEVRLNSYIRDLFEETLPYVKYIEGELEELEPQYLTAPVPLGLLGVNDVITGLSFNITRIPLYHLSDLCKRLTHLLDNKPKDQCIIKPLIINCNLYEENGDDFFKILTEGKGTIIVEPKMKITKKYIEIVGKSPIGGFNALIDKAEELDISVIDNSKKSTGTKIIVEYNKRKSIDNDLVKRVTELVTYKIHFIVNVVNENGVVETVGIDDLLLNNYYKFKECHIARINHNIERLKQQIFEVEVILVIREILNQNPGVKKVDEIVDIFNKSFKSKHPNISDEDIRNICSKKTIKNLIEHEYDKSKYIKALQAEEQNLARIDSILKTKISKYI